MATKLTLDNESNEIVSKVTDKYKADVVDDKRHDALPRTGMTPANFPIIKTNGMRGLSAAFAAGPEAQALFCRRRHQPMRRTEPLWTASRHPHGFAVNYDTDRLACRYRQQQDES